jgi:aldehyde dehydrogenase (NAD+)
MQTHSSDLQLESIDSVFKLQQGYQFSLASTTPNQRIGKLKLLQKTILSYRDEIKKALYLDFKKHPFEVDLTEIYTVIREIKHAKGNLRRWVGKHHVSTPLALFGSSSYIQYEPKGVVLIISPWNFPVTLTLGPLVGAIAAGNTVILKPSEKTPHATEVMRKIIAEVFPPEEVMLFAGGIETSKALLALPFNHIFFTGSSRVGKIVMEAASKHLTSVTLELGGKSPTIIDETADIDQAAKRIIWAKGVNCGQICIAPDHVFVHEKVLEKFISAAKTRIEQFYTANPAQAPSYARLINKDHFQKVNDLLNDAVAKGARISMGGTSVAEENFISLTILTDIPANAKIAEEEIFGPILPIHTFKNIRNLLQILQAREKPLATYIYSKNRKNIRDIIQGTRSGGTCVNSSGIHFYNTNLPFGGSNFSGIGKGHGWYGFEAFSNARAVYRQIFPGALEFLAPPYNSLKQKVLDLTIKYL